MMDLKIIHLYKYLTPIIFHVILTHSYTKSINNRKIHYAGSNKKQNSRLLQKKSVDNVGGLDEKLHNNIFLQSAF
jgi:hypothetical protein